MFIFHSSPVSLTSVFATTLFFLGTTLCPVWANSASQKAPVEISADDAIEWLRDQNLYRATGNAIAKQGDTAIHASVLEASYDPQKGEQDIQSVTARGQVKIISADRTITAEQGVYDMASGLVTLTGSNIVLTSPDIKVTAHNKVTYNSNAGHATASGNATVSAQGRTLKAQEIEAWFGDSATKNTSKTQNVGALKRARARGNVVIQTEKEILQADQADYNLVTQEAIMTGRVRLTQGENHMQGERAVVNLKTGVSQLFGQNKTGTASNTGSSGGRVKALFFPGKGSTSIMPTNATRDMIPLRPDDPAPKGQTR
jgi:lipopolysaccharide export system protein LptA